MEEGPSRKLAVLLHADVAGSTALVRLNETLAHQRIQDAFRRFSETIVSCNGIAHEVRGDALVAEFSKASDALEAALSFQESNAAHLNDLGHDIKALLRVGIAMGEVVVADDTVTGEAVVLAQRLEQLAEPGGVCIQGTAQNTVPKRLGFDYEDLGDHQLKGFEEPVRVYRVTNKVSDSVRVTERGSGSASKPSIAVLPFTNMSGDPEQEYFSDGITEDIITELSRFRELFVIARNSSFTFKGEAADVKEVGKRLGVAYVLEGSVRKAGNRVRVTAQLIEASSANHLWAERYDRELEDIFAIQDELVAEIVTAIPGQLDAHALRDIQSRPSEDISAYQLFLQAEWLGWQDLASNQVRELYERAVSIDPRCALAYARLAMIHAYSIFLFRTSFDDADEKVRQLIDKSLALEPNSAAIHIIAAVAFLILGEHQLARRHRDRAVQLSQNEPRVVAFGATLCIYFGEADESRLWLERQIRHDPLGDTFLEQKFDLEYLCRQFSDAIETFSTIKSPPHHMVAEFAAANAMIGCTKEAHAAAHRYLEGLERRDQATQFIHAHARMCQREEDRELWLEGYRKAGLPV